jgi:putative transposase
MVMDRWVDLSHMMQPATVKRWHTQAFRLYWRRKSRPGRPTISQEMQSLIRMLSRENPLWSAERIHDTLLLLGYDPSCEDTIRKYMIKPRKPRNKSSAWLPFLRNHLDVSWAMDFFTVTTIGFSTFYVFLIFDHGRRKVMHMAVTSTPSMKWVIQQLREAMPFGLQPRYLLRDNDKIYGSGVPTFLKRCGIEEVRTAYRSPWKNPYLERFIGTLRRELLDHVIILNQHHLKRLLKEYIDEYYHVARPHQGLNRDTPLPSPKPQPIPGPSQIISIPVVGGLHHRYERVAAWS